MTDKNQPNVGGHFYPGVPEDDFSTSDCSYKCGCWMGRTRSGGPDGIDPFGPCPNNPGVINTRKSPLRDALTPPDRTTERLKALRSVASADDDIDGNDQAPASEDNVVSLAEEAHDSRMWTPEQVLELALKDVQSGRITSKKLMVVYADDQDEGYHAGFIQSGLSMSQTVALCEVIKTMCLQQMGYIRDGSEY